MTPTAPSLPSMAAAVQQQHSALLMMLQCSRQVHTQHKLSRVDCTQMILSQYLLCWQALQDSRLEQTHAQTLQRLVQ
jgi:hypothetical protein